jgi:RNA polymerase sigma-70 factor (ECF subfamily)
MVELTPSLMADVLDRFRSGDEQAFLEIYRDCATDVRLWVSNFFDSRFDQEEAVQETWLTVHRMRCSYDADRGPLRPWLKALTFNRCREILRARGRRPQHEVEPDETLECDKRRPDEHVLLSRIREAIARFAASLAGDERRTFLALLNESSHVETAQLLAVNVRRCKYLRQKIMVRAVNDPHLRDASYDLLDCN